jgi:hypothetical protein
MSDECCDCFISSIVSNWGAPLDGSESCQGEIQTAYPHRSNLQQLTKVSAAN